MKILIVDDNSNNRTLLELLLRNYEEENDSVVFEIDQVDDGAKAVKSVQEGKYDIIFMDIMMPVMNGIEATKKIRSIDPKVMIIAVSASDDASQQREILSSGAEDYLEKPIDHEIFLTRMGNYIKLVQLRTHKMVNTGVQNLFTQEVYSRHTAFILSTEDAMAEFWEFFLLNAREKNEDLSNIVRFLYSVAEKQLLLSDENILYIEENEQKQYFTLTNIDVLPPKVIEILRIKNGIKDRYKIDDNKISFEYTKPQKTHQEDAQEEVVVQPTNQMVQDKEVVQEEAVEVEIPKTSELQVFDYLDPDDYMDIDEYIGRLSSLLLIAGSGDMTDEEIAELSAYLDKIAAILASYSEVYPISVALQELSIDIAEHIDGFRENAEALGDMCKAFSNDLVNWKVQSFETGAPSADFMNDSIIANAQMISSMLKMDDNAASADGGDDLDDIFDF